MDTKYFEQMIESEASSYSSLTALNSTSKTGVFYALKKVVAFVATLLSNIWQDNLTTLKAIKLSSVIGSKTWYQDQFLRYQHGDPLVITSNSIGYSVIDESKQILKCVSVSTTDGKVYVRVAKKESDNINPLTPTELIAVKHYAEQIELAGDNVIVVSEDGDNIWGDIQIYYDPQIGDETSFLLLTRSVFFEWTKEIPFSGKKTLSDLENKLKAKPGITEALVTKLYTQSYPGTGAITEHTRSVTADKGFFTFDPTSTTINLFTDDQI